MSECLKDLKQTIKNVEASGAPDEVIEAFCTKTTNYIQEVLAYDSFAELYGIEPFKGTDPFIMKPVIEVQDTEPEIVGPVVEEIKKRVDSGRRVTRQTVKMLMLDAKGEPAQTPEEKLSLAGLKHEDRTDRIRIPNECKKRFIKMNKEKKLGYSSFSAFVEEMLTEKMDCYNK